MAVLLMYAGAALTVIGTAADVIDVAVGGTAGLRADHPHATAAQLHATLSALITSIVFSGLIEAALWLFMARANRSGVPWARIIASGLLAVSTVLLVTGFIGSSPATSKAFPSLIWLIASPRYGSSGSGSRAPTSARPRLRQPPGRQRRFQPPRGPADHRLQAEPAAARSERASPVW